MSDRPEDCVCITEDTLPCAACFFDGFDSPNPDAPETRSDSETKRRFHADCGGRLRAQSRGPLYRCAKCEAEMEMEETDEIEIHEP